MAQTVENWTHREGYKLFGANTISKDGDRIEYQHDNEPHLLGVAEGIIDNASGDLQIYVTVFDTRPDPWEKIAPREYHDDPVEAQEHLLELLEQNS